MSYPILFAQALHGAAQRVVIIGAGTLGLIYPGYYRKTPRHSRSGTPYHLVDRWPRHASIARTG